MKKIFLLVLFLGLILIGGSCGGDENGEDLGDINLNKELSESEIKAVLLKTAEDLNWPTEAGFSGQKGWYTFQRKSGALVRRGLSIIEVSWLPMIVAGGNKDNFLNKVYEQGLAQEQDYKTYNYDPQHAGISVKMIKIADFDAYHKKEYFTAWGDLEDCSEDDFVHIIIGNYLLQAMTHDMKEGRGVVCEKEDAMPIAETLVKNFLDALK